MAYKCKLYKCGPRREGITEINEIKQEATLTLGKKEALYSFKDGESIESDYLGTLQLIHENIIVKPDKGNQYYGFNIKIDQKEVPIQYNIYLGQSIYIMLQHNNEPYIIAFKGLDQLISTKDFSKPCVIGSSSDCSIVIKDDPRIYPKHCVITKKENSFIIKKIDPFAEIYINAGSAIDFKIPIDADKVLIEVRVGEGSYILIEPIYAEAPPFIAEYRCSLCGKYTSKILHMKACTSCYYCPNHMIEACKGYLKNTIQYSSPSVVCNICKKKFPIDDIIENIVYSKLNDS